MIPELPFTAIDPMLLQGRRVTLRPWRADDLPVFAALNADPATMAHFPAPLARAASDAMAERCQQLIEARGWGFWALQCHAPGLPSGFIGFVGLHTPAADLPFSPCVEIGWRLLRSHWGHGLASEAARLALRVGFDALSLDEIVAFTATGNLRSRAVMERLGMQRHAQDDFEHPALPADHALRHHVLYRLPQKRWHAQCIAPTPH
jgi:RimJ/RimL family protein N-acetyltransferase